MKSTPGPDQIRYLRFRLPLFAWLVIIILCRHHPMMAEGTKELNSNFIQSTELFLCNDFTNHCSSGAGIRSNFASYDATQSAADADRLYFVTLNASEVVFLGFKGGGLNSPATPARHIVYRIRNLAGTIVQAEQNLPTAGTGYISTFNQALNGPNQLPSPPITAGYDALVFTPPSPGTYYIEFSVRRNDNNNFYIGTFNLSLVDITVGNTATHSAKPGRLYSKTWQFEESSSFYGKTYIFSDDGIVTSAQFTGMQGGHWIQYCNQTGCGNSSATWLTNRKSMYHQQALFPQYKIFLNQPDPAIFPPATTLGQIIPPLPYGVQNCTTGHILFHVNVDKAGNAELNLVFPPPYQPRTLAQAVVTGDNVFDWDGLDGTTPVGLPVPNNTNIQFTVEYINGLTNLPLYDVEGNDYGFTIALVSPSGTTPAVYWDDTNIPSGTSNTNPPGCTSPPGCHVWASAGGGGFGDLNTMNTWWYNVSTVTAPATIVTHRGSQTLTFNQSPPQNFCPNTSNVVFSVTPEINTTLYHWSYNPPAGVTISQATPASNTVSVSFGPTAASGTLQVYGTNANCPSPGPTSSLPVTILAAPVPTITGLNSVCTGQAGVVYNTEAGKTNYQWNVSAGGTITAGGTSTSNSVTVTWNTAGSQSVSVSYQSGTPPCTAAAPTVYPVIVNPRPVPTISGNTLVCVGTAGVVYATETGKLNYVWNISSGGTITAGGNSTSNSVTVTWTTTGAKTVSVSYTNPGTNCTAVSPTVLNVTVNSLPSPTFLSGSTSVCRGVPGNVYATEAGMTNYVWAVTGGTITAGGTSTSNTATVTWNTAGTQSISINYTYPSSTCTAPAPTILNVTVKPLPTPSFVGGNNSVCEGSAGNTYTTQAGMTGYIWLVTGGIITAGGGLNNNFATITWTAAGMQSVSINYTDPATNCTAVNPAVFPVTVKPLPVPWFTGGPASVCLNSAGSVYSTQPEMTSYTWNVTGGTITAGGGPSDPSVTVTWTAAGSQSVAVGYTNPSTQCTAAAPAVMNVNVLQLPEPSFVAGAGQVCLGSAGNVYQTQPGMLNYTWTVTGGTITAGGGAGDYAVTVTWTTAGMQSVGVSYTSPFTGCSAAAPVIFPVNVMTLAQPTISGPAAACVNVAGILYNTEPGMSNYTWTVPGGVMLPGPTPESISVNWTAIGTHTITLTYNGPNGCSTGVPAEQAVIVNTVPAPTITGPTVICSGIPATYQTENGMMGYAWTFSEGGTVTGGGTSSDPSITVNWTIPGPQEVTVNYALGTGCTAPGPSVINVTVNPSTTPVILQSPDGQVCLNATATYTVQPGMSSYLWAISSGGIITSPVNGNTISVLWNTPGPGWVTANFTNPDGCTAPSPAQATLTVNPLPVTTITTQSGPHCESAAHEFQVPPDPSCTFTWSVAPASSGMVSTGQGTNGVMILWQVAGNALVSVTGTNNTTGCSTSASHPVTVHPSPNPVFTPCFDLFTTPNARKFTLRGASPFLAGQGIFTGNHVSLDATTGFYQFDPLGAAPGAYPVTYTYTNTFGCAGSPPPVIITIQNSAFICGGPLTDIRDGKSYTTSMIGGRCWMTENLDAGTVIDSSLPSTDNCITEKYCQPMDAGCTEYGGLYQWNELMRYGYTTAGQGICPPEWHVPSEPEWQSLLAALGTGVNPPDGVAGHYLKDPFLANGFHALLTGLLYHNHSWAFNSTALAGSMFWTNTLSPGGSPVARGVNSYNPGTSWYAGTPGNAFSLRCVKD
jgi:uncharacterized protein (TIGR02145 family)